MEWLHHYPDIIVKKSVCHDFLFPIFELVSGWQFTVNEQEGNFQEIRFLSQLLNGNSSVFQNPFVSINEGDFWSLDFTKTHSEIILKDKNYASYSVHVTRIIGSERFPLGVHEFGQIIGVDKVVFDGYFNGFAWTVVG